MKYIKNWILYITILFPSFYIHAADFNNTSKLFDGAGNAMNKLLWVVSTAAVLTFFWGIVKYISSSGDAEGAKKGKSIMIYGAVALFVLFSIFGIIGFLQGEFGVGGESKISSPNINF